MTLERLKIPILSGRVHVGDKRLGIAEGAHWVLLRLPRTMHTAFATQHAELCAKLA